MLLLQSRSKIRIYIYNNLSTTLVMLAHSNLNQLWTIIVISESKYYRNSHYPNPHKTDRRIANIISHRPYNNTALTSLSYATTNPKTIQQISALQRFLGMKTEQNT